MKAQFHKILVERRTSFTIRHDQTPYFGTTWHYHPELELVYIIKGQGLRLIGDNISPFSAGEMVLIGANQPHAWQCDKEYFQNNPDLPAEAIVLQFAPECLGRYLLNLPDAYVIPALFERAKSGLLIGGATKSRLEPLLRAAVHATGLERIILLLSILNILGKNVDLQTISSSGHAFRQHSETKAQRIEKVYRYSALNYKKEITLEAVAALSNLTVTSFCRYFKLITRKTYYDFLTEIRISQACRMLIENKWPTEVICFECGFNNVSNFYRHFKKITNLTPLDYKRKYLRHNLETKIAA
jgi:AraC-like DNA-binding protein